MLKYFHRDHLFSLIATLMLMLCFFLPQILYWNEGHKGAVILHIDEYSYAGRVQRVLQNQPVCNTWVYEKKGAPCLVPPYPEYLVGNVAKIVGLDAEDVMIISRLLFAFILSALLILASHFLGMKRSDGALAALAAFTLACSWYMKPGMSLINTPSMQAFNRYLNPLFNLIPFLLTWISSIQLFKNNESNIKRAILTGILLGLTFYTSIFYWTHLCLLIFIAWLCFDPKKRWPDFVAIVLSSLIVSLPYWINFFQIMQHPVYPFIGWRNGIMIKDRGWFLFKGIGLYPALLASVYLCWRKDFSSRWQGLSLLSVFICYLAPVITGRELQNFHYKYTIVPLLLLAYIHLGRIAISPRLPMACQRWALRFFFFFVVSGLGIRNAIHFYKLNQYLSADAVAKEYQQAFDWLKNNANPNAVVLTSPQTDQAIPLKTGLRTFLDNGTEFSANPEILERQLIFFYLFSGEAMPLQPPDAETLTIPIWNWGLTAEREQQLLQQNLPTLQAPLRLELWQEMRKLVGQMDENQFKAMVSRLKLDYVLLGPREKQFAQNRLSEFFQMEKAADLGAVAIWKVLGLK